MIAQLLSTHAANEFFGNISDIHNNSNLSIFEKIPKLRSQLEYIYKSLVSGEKETFFKLVTRMHFIERKFKLPDNLAVNLHSLRISANKILHENYSPDNDEYFIYLSAITELLTLFSDAKPPQILNDNFNIYKDKITKFNITTLPEDLFTINAIVLKNHGVKHRENYSSYVDLFCSNEETSEKFSVRFWNSGKYLSPAFSSAVLCLDYSKVLIKNIKLFNAEKKYYTTNNTTQLIIEPDFLLSATDLAGAFHRNNHYSFLFFINKILPSSSNINLVRGKIINKLLDSILTNPTYKIDDILLDYIKEDPLLLLQFDLKSLEDIITEIKRTHLIKLQDFAKSLLKKNIKIEPTFYSSQYGIYGRMDVLLDEKRDNFYKTVFELKTGTPPFSGIWPNEEIQTSVYYLLLKSTYGDNNNYNSQIIYSAADIKNYIRNSLTNMFFLNNIIFLRNKIVTEIFRLATNNINIFGYFLDSIDNKVFSFPSFILSKINFLKINFNNITNMEIDKAFYSEYFAFILRENINSAIGTDNIYESNSKGFSSLWLDDLSTKKENYNIITELSFREINSVSNTIIFKINSPQIFNFRENDIALLYPQNFSSNPLNSQILKVTIRQINDNIISLEMRNKIFESDYFIKEKYWCIEPDYMDFSAYSNIASLTSFLFSSGIKRSLIYGLSEPEYENIAYLNDPELDEHQNYIVKSALKAKNYYLIQGPPGTGKTSTILTKITSFLFNNSDKRIFILAFTNRAVNEISNKLLQKKIPFLHIGKTLPEYTSSNIYDIAMKISKPKQLKSILDSNRIFISTISSFKKYSEYFSITTNDLLIVDEASQLFEPELLGTLSLFNKFILIGDHNQLPPVTTQKNKSCLTNNPVLNKIGIFDLRTSTFERLYENAKNKNWNHCYNMLKTQYRMNDKICSLIQPFYGNQLISFSQQQKNENLNYKIDSNNKIHQLLNNYRLIFIPSEISSISRSNDYEAEKIIALLNAYLEIFSDDFNVSTVGVITPWRAQISNIKSRISNPKIKMNVSVDTIERFQGSEKKIIIISTCLRSSSQLANIQNLNVSGTVDRKFNVALSRAQEQLIVFGNLELLKTNYFYNNLINHIKDNGIITTI